MEKESFEVNKELLDRMYILSLSCREAKEKAENSQRQLNLKEAELAAQKELFEETLNKMDDLIELNEALESDNNDLKEKVGGCEQKCVSLQKETDTVEKELRKIVDENAGLRHELQDNKKLKECELFFQCQIADIQKKFNLLNHNYVAVCQERSALRLQLNGHCQERTSLRLQLNANQGHFAHLHNEHQKEIEYYKRLLNEHQKEIEHFKRSLTRVPPNKTIDELAENHKKLQAQLNFIKANMAIQNDE